MQTTKMSTIGWMSEQKYINAMEFYTTKNGEPIQEAIMGEPHT